MHRNEPHTKLPDVSPAAVGGDTVAGAQLPKAKAPGVVYTRPWAAEFILDLAGYTRSVDLAAGRAVEPSCGRGAFLVPMVERLVDSCAAYGRDLSDAGDALRAWEIDPDAVIAARAAAVEVLVGRHVDGRTAVALAEQWVRQGDFLLASCEPSDWVVGNPPYVRIEDLPAGVSRAYRQRWHTMRGRADLYVGFFQAGLEALKPGGVLAFLCADRWLTSQYGQALRTLIEKDFSTEVIVALHDADVFEGQVNAYPAAVRIRSAAASATLRVEAGRDFGPADSAAVVDLLGSGAAGETRVSDVDARGGEQGSGRSSVSWVKPPGSGGRAWPTGSPENIAIVADLEGRFVSLADEAAGVRIGIGLTTGADSVYVTQVETAVEPDRLVPIAKAADLVGSRVAWSGGHLISPWSESGDLVDLNCYPLLEAYLAAHATRLRGRYVARRNPDRWYRTIDKPHATLRTDPKLLMPDLRPRVQPALDDGSYYPHHNLTWLTSDIWNLEVLGGLLLSDFGTLFVTTYAPHMAGGALRVTPQSLRRVCVPDPQSIPSEVGERLARAFRCGDTAAATRAASDAYKSPMPNLARRG